MADRFYVNCPLAPGPAVLTGPEAHHLATVLRARLGQPIYLFNGDGAEYLAVVGEIGKKEVYLEITDRRTPKRELAFRLEVAAPLPKGDRVDFLIEKLTELGATRFVPLRTRRSVVHSRPEKLRRAVIEASKQCGRNVLMEIGPLTAWEEYVADCELPALRLLGHPGGGAIPDHNGDVTLAVGPEGGLTDEEVTTATAAGWRTIDLGPRILRVETAAVALAVMCAALRSPNPTP